ncbi:MAG: universal stress protein [Microthrixaceae bacterium]
MKIVVGVDDSEPSKAALRFAAEEAAVGDAELVAVTAWDLPPLALGYVSPGDARESMGPWLDGVVREVLGAAGDSVTKVVETGSPSGALLRTAKDADLLVVGSRGHGALLGAILGSVSHQVANHTPCPLTVVPHEDDEAARTGPVVVGVDGSANSAEALRWAAARALRLGRQLRVVMAWRGDPVGWFPPSDVASTWPDNDDFHAQARQMLAEVVEEARLPGSLAVEQVLGEGTPAAVIGEVLDDASMLVLGARGRGGFVGLLLGSVTAHLLNHPTCPITVVPSGDAR